TCSLIHNAPAPKPRPSRIISQAASSKPAPANCAPLPMPNLPPFVIPKSAVRCNSSPCVAARLTLIPPLLSQKTICPWRSRLSFHPINSSPPLSLVSTVQSFLHCPLSLRSCKLALRLDWTVHVRSRYLHIRAQFRRRTPE